MGACKVLTLVLKISTRFFRLTRSDVLLLPFTLQQDERGLTRLASQFCGPECDNFFQNAGFQSSARTHPLPFSLSISFTFLSTSSDVKPVGYGESLVSAAVWPHCHVQFPAIQATAFYLPGN